MNVVSSVSFLFFIILFYFYGDIHFSVGTFVALVCVRVVTFYVCVRLFRLNKVKLRSAELGVITFFGVSFD